MAELCVVGSATKLIYPTVMKLFITVTTKDMELNKALGELAEDMGELRNLLTTAYKLPVETGPIFSRLELLSKAEEERGYKPCNVANQTIQVFTATDKDLLVELIDLVSRLKYVSAFRFDFGLNPDDTEAVHMEATSAAFNHALSQASMYKSITMSSTYRLKAIRPVSGDGAVYCADRVRGADVQSGTGFTQQQAELMKANLVIKPIEYRVDLECLFELVKRER